MSLLSRDPVFEAWRPKSASGSKLTFAKSCQVVFHIMNPMLRTSPTAAVRWHECLLKNFAAWLVQFRIAQEPDFATFCKV